MDSMLQKLVRLSKRQNGNFVILLPGILFLYAVEAILNGTRRLRKALRGKPARRLAAAALSLCLMFNLTPTTVFAAWADALSDMSGVGEQVHDKEYGTYSDSPFSDGGDVTVTGQMSDQAVKIPPVEELPVEDLAIEGPPVEELPSENLSDQADIVKDICICATFCTEDGISPECPVCSAEGADLSLCLGTKKQDSAYEEVVALFEALPNPDSITAETTAEEKAHISARISAALDALDGLSYEDFAKFNKEHSDLLAAVALLQATILSDTPTTLDTGLDVSSFIELQNAIDSAAGTADAPTLISIDSAGITLGSTITIDGKHVKLTGGTLTRGNGFTFNMVEVKNGGSLTLENITLDGNNVPSSGSLIKANGTANLVTAITLENGTVLENNTMTGSGSAVYLYAGGQTVKFTMNGGTIQNNTAANGGAISDNGWGTAVVEINGGTITGNTANGTNTDSTYGGAINNSGTLLIKGGSITNNYTANGRGGGIYKTGGTKSLFTITGGTISGNTARGYDVNPVGGSGNNVYVNQGIFIMGGGVNIPDGLYLKPNNPSFYISSALQNSVEIEGIYDNPMAGQVVASGWTDTSYSITNDDLNKFSYRNNAFGFELDGNEIKLKAFAPTGPVPSVISNNIYANGAAIQIVAGTTPDYTNILYDANGDGIIEDSEYLKIGTENPTAEGYALSSYIIYGGGNSSTITGDTSVTMTGGKVMAIYGGCSNSSITVNTSVTITGGQTSFVYGGGAGEGTTVGDTMVTISGGDATYVYGGGSSDWVTGKATVNISGGTVSSVYGGGHNGKVTNEAALTITGGKVFKVCGGNDDSSIDNSSVTVGGNVTIGNAGGNAGIAINGSTVTNGADSFKIDPSLEEDSIVYVVLPEGYTTGTIATNAVQADLAKIHLTGPGANGKAAVFDSDHNTIIIKATPSLALIGSTKYLFANGLDLQLEPGDTDGRTKVSYRAMEDSSAAYTLYAVPGAYGSMQKGYDLSEWNICGGSIFSDVNGGTKITMTGGEVKRIYGGGQSEDNSSAAVTGDVSISVTGGKVDTVYGGGQGGTVKGNTVVTLDGGTIGYIYGGSTSKGSVEGSASVLLKSGTVSGSVYGGSGYSFNLDGIVSDDTVKGEKTVTVSGSVTIGNAVGSGAGIAINGNGNPEIKSGVDSFKIDPGMEENSSVYVFLPEGYTTGTIATNAVQADLAKIHLTGPGAKHKKAEFDSDHNTIIIKATPSVETIESTKYLFANGLDLQLESGDTDGYTKVSYRAMGDSSAAYTPYEVLGADGSMQDGYNLSEWNICGGSSFSDVNGGTKITMTGGKVDTVYGGGYAPNNSSAAVTGNVSISMTGGTVNYIYGGGYGKNATVGSEDIPVNVTILLGDNARTKSIYGGGWCDMVYGSISINVRGTVEVNVYGGGDGSTVNGDTSVTLNGGIVGWTIYGGGASATVRGKASIFLKSGTVGWNVYGSNSSGIKNAVVTVGGNVTIGSENKGIVINGGSGSTENAIGVDSFIIDPSLEENSSVYVFLPEGYTTGTIATNAVQADLAKIHLTGDGAKHKTAAFNNNTILVKSTYIPPTGIAPTITTASLPNGTVGTQYNQTLTATGDAAITWSITSGSLPAGMFLTGSTGVITGTPSAAGTCSFTVKAANATGSHTRQLSITVASPEPAVTGVTVSPNPVILQKGTTQQFTAAVSGSNTPAQAVTWAVTGGMEGTSISDTGLLTVAADETAAVLTVEATSAADASKSGTAAVIVQNGTLTDGQRIATAKSAVDAVLANLTVTNATTADEILNAAEAAISAAGQTGITISWDGTDGFAKTEATETAEGSITGTLKLTLNNESGTVALNKIIALKTADKVLSGGTLNIYDRNNLLLTGDKLNFNYNGTAHTYDKAVFQYHDTALKLTEGVDYEIRYVDNVYGKKDTSAQKGAVLVVAKGAYAGGYDGNGVVKGIYTDAQGSKTENVIYAQQFEIAQQDVLRSNVSVSDGTYAGGLEVNPAVSINVNGKTLVEGTDFNLSYPDGTELTQASAPDGLKVTIVLKNGYKAANNQDMTFNWGINKFDLANADITVKDGNVTVKCGKADVNTSEYTIIQNDNGTITVEAEKDSRNYTGRQTVEGQVIQTPEITAVSHAVADRNTIHVTVIKPTTGASYDYVLCKSEEDLTEQNFFKANKSVDAASSQFLFVRAGSYKVYARAITRDADGKKTYSGWSKAADVTIRTDTPNAAAINRVTVNGNKVTVTFTPGARTEGVDVMLGQTLRSSNGEPQRPVTSNFAKYLQKNLRAAAGKRQSVTFTKVAKGTHYIGVHPYINSSDQYKYFGRWSKQSGTTKVVIK